MEDGLPEHVVTKLGDFHEKISSVEQALKPMLATSLDKCHQNMTPLEKAKLDLVSLYAANSLFWVYLSTKGLDPKDYAVTDELEKVKKYMEKIKQIEDKSKMPKLNHQVAKSFIRNALFDSTETAARKSGAEKQTLDDDVIEEATTSKAATPSGGEKEKRGKKRKRERGERDNDDASYHKNH